MQNVEFEINQIFNNRKYCIKYMTMLHIAFKKNINPLRFIESSALCTRGIRLFKPLTKIFNIDRVFFVFMIGCTYIMYKFMYIVH